MRIIDRIKLFRGHRASELLETARASAQVQQESGCSRFRREEGDQQAVEAELLRQRKIVSQKHGRHPSLIGEVGDEAVDPAVMLECPIGQRVLLEREREEALV